MDRNFYPPETRVSDVFQKVWSEIDNFCQVYLTGSVLSMSLTIMDITTMLEIVENPGFFMNFEDFRSSANFLTTRTFHAVISRVLNIFSIGLKILKSLGPNFQNLQPDL